MTNQIFGVFIIIFCACIYFLSFHFKKKENYGVGVALLMLSGLALRLFASADFFLHPWDEVFHAVVSKHYIKHPFVPTLYDTPVLPYNYQNWTGNYIWVHKQPLPLWTMALSMFLFGVNEIALRLPSVLLTTAGIILTYSIGKYFFDKRVGYLAAFFYSINGLIIEMAAGKVPTDHIDDFFLFFVEISVFFSIAFSRNKNILLNICAGLSIGAAVLCKWLPAYIVLPIWVLIMLDSEKFTIREIALHLFILLAVSVCIFLPWQIYINKTFPIEAAWEAGYNMKHITQVLDHQGGPFYYYLNKIRINYGELIYLPFLWFTWLIFKNIFNYKRLALFIWFAVPIVFFSLIKTKMQGYILFAAPAIFIVAAGFWYTLLEYRANLKTEMKYHNQLKWLTTILLILLIALPIRYGIERTKPFQKDRNPQWVVDLKQLKQKNIDKGVLLNYEKPIDDMFYTDLLAYPNIPDVNSVQDLVQKGYTVLINDNGSIPDDIRKINTIVIVHLASPTP